MTWKSCKKEPPTSAEGKLCIIEVRDPKWEIGQQITVLYENNKYLMYNDGAKINYTTHVRNWSCVWQPVIKEEYDRWAKHLTENKKRYEEKKKK